MANLNVRDLKVRLGSNDILKGVSVSFKQGDVVALLGQSGSGKTTLLRSIAGLEQPSAGTITVDDRVIFDAATATNLPPEKRGLGLVFQSYALWPHKTVFDNVAYGMRLRGVDRASLALRVKAAMDGIGIGHLGDRLPHQLSGGQQQRVALARAMVYDPPVILLDEPLSNLDAKLREEARIWIRGLIKESGRTAVFVTHDQEEALAVADKVVLLDGGTIVQSGTPEELYSEPQSLFASTFMGSNNVIPTRIVERRGDKARISIGGSDIWGTLMPGVKETEATAVIRVENLTVTTDMSNNAIEAELDTSLYLGSRWEHIFKCGTERLRTTQKKRLPAGRHRLDVSADHVWIF
ncbi:ABC transporter ATP-binding protein [Agrobacterium tumefaciens]|uniref:ABC transporter ATP-binding protein n=1 Tax=Agrobacterium tumefaciens TaxID=358 RepID=A0AA44J9G9_AGRTU|nr:ABC transporter ATP-binding protein [Agrobacterium tumefaciens]NTB87554.1 ABC transporter ATP-binding protein [Agrobacterium tumefaciens]NTC19751.1 ABC transporter ATP-binding protein [Agrobacterium tumefaciens]NTC29679.1 ABC transporter ATP-binding protein [Agrobacterium tumefaciens]